jgi:hypothetical protein
MLRALCQAVQGGRGRCPRRRSTWPGEAEYARLKLIDRGTRHRPVGVSKRVTGGTVITETRLSLGLQSCQLGDHCAASARQAVSSLGEREHLPGVTVVGRDHALTCDYPGAEGTVFGLGGGLRGGTKRPSRLMLVTEIEQRHASDGGKLRGSTAQTTPMLDGLVTVEVVADDRDGVLDRRE